MEKGEIGLSITKVPNSLSGQTYNIWLHIDCILPFTETLKKGLEENTGELVLKAL